MTPEDMIEEARARGCCLWVLDGSLRVSDPRRALGDLVQVIGDMCDELVERLRDYRPGEPDWTPDAPYGCACCARFFGEDALEQELCPVCAAAVAEAMADLRQNPEADEQTLAEKYALTLRRFLGIA